MYCSDRGYVGRGVGGIPLGVYLRGGRRVREVFSPGRCHLPLFGGVEPSTKGPTLPQERQLQKWLEEQLVAGIPRRVDTRSTSFEVKESSFLDVEEESERVEPSSKGLGIPWGGDKVSLFPETEGSGFVFP